MSVAAADWRSITVAMAAIAGLPTMWNVVARNEYHRHTLERLVGGPRRGAYLLAVCIFLCSSLRDWAFKCALVANPPERVLPLLARPTEKMAGVLKAVGTALLAFGTTLVVSSFVRLGVTGTYLGDYFGIRLPKRVTAFPFSHFQNPMYLGATVNFFGASVAQNSGVGVALSVWVAAVYHVATVYFEGPFTDMMYANDKGTKVQSKKKA